MWLVYFRFDVDGAVKTYHVRTGSKDDVQYLLQLAERHGLACTERLVEHAAFAVSGTIKLKPMVVPNFHFTSTPSLYSAGKRLNVANRRCPRR
jgi:hypothetical protein